MESTPPAKVVTRTDPASTAECPFGGVIITAGLDSNGNGKLDDAEIKTRTMVCNDAPAQPPPVILVRLVPEPANGGHCPAGGTAVQSGPDRNGNGRLDDDEVAHTDFVCGLAALTRLVPEPASGGHCAEGGTAVQSGLDRNGNGRLDDDEVAHTDFVCGLAVLTRLDAEPVGDRCAAGGVVFSAGLDRDGNGALDNTEVVSTEISCGDRIERDVDIRTFNDDFALKDVRVITGKVTVLRGNFTLPKLAQIGGALQFIEGSGGTIALPALQSVGGELALRNSGVTALDCPQLRRTGSLTVLQSALHDLSGFPVLAEIAGDVTIGSSALVSATLPSTSPVKIAGNLQLGGTSNLQRADWTVEDRLGNVNVGGLASFTLAVVPVHQPRSALGDVRMGSISSIRLSANEVSSIQLDGSGFHDVALDFGLVDKDLQIFATTSPFELTLSDPAQNGQLRVAGTLRIQGTLAALHTTDAVFVEGLLHLNSTQLRELAPLGLIHAHGELDIVNNPLLTLVAPIEVTGSLVVKNNALLSTLAFPRFGAQGEVFGGVLVTDNPVLTSAPALALLSRVHGDVVIQSNTLLAAPFGQALVQIDGGLDISSTTSTELSLPNFAQVGTFVRVFGNGLLGTVSMPALATVPGELLISSNDQLRSLAFGALTHAGTFTVRDNPHLPTCAVVALFGRVDGEHSQSGNDDDATCAR